MDRGIRCCALVFLLVASCRDIAQEFVGDWLLASGDMNTSCADPTFVGPHRLGDIALQIRKTDNQTIGILMSRYEKDEKLGYCDLTADVALDVALARLRAKDCKFGGNAYNVVEGEMYLENHASMIFGHTAEVVDLSGHCWRRSGARFSRQGKD